MILSNLALRFLEAKTIYTKSVLFAEKCLQIPLHEVLSYHLEIKSRKLEIRNHLILSGKILTF